MLFTTITLLATLAVAPQDDTAVAATKADDKTDGAVALMNVFIGEQNIDKSKGNWKTRLPEPPELSFTKGVDYFWHLKTNMGDITIRFMPDHAPMHVSSTIYLTKLGFYDDLKFHRVITGFMAQGGCPLGRGTGGPGYKYAGEFDRKVQHSKPGILSMANAGPRTDGSQFFLTFVPTPHLNGKHTIFGETVKGMDVLKKLEALGSRNGQTKEPLKIVKATISTAKKKAEKKDG